MLDIFSGLRLVVKRRTINIDNAIFRCHWFFTSTLLISFSLIITARQYVGQPIECHSVNKIPDSLLNSYCWVQSTFSVPQACNNQQIGVDVPYPCIDNTRGREVKMFAYYQWVGMVLFIQGLMFHLPYYLWKLWENGLIKAITGGLRIAVLNEQERVRKKEIVVEYINDHLGCHRRYAMKYFLCEFICLLNLIGQLWATNKFFDGQFLRYGLEVIHYSSNSLSSQFGISLGTPSKTSSNHENTSSNSSTPFPQNSQDHNSNQSPVVSNSRIKSTSWLHYQQQQVNRQHEQARQDQQIDPMTYIFPRMTKCTYYDFGSSGDVQKHDALCLLPLNIINEKIYIALWFWFLILAILTLLVIIYRLLAMVSEDVRCKGLISRCKLSSERDIRLICNHCDVGDWFLFYMVAENLDPLIMREIVASIAIRIRQHLEIKQGLCEQTAEEFEKEKLKLLANDTHNDLAAQLSGPRYGWPPAPKYQHQPSAPYEGDLESLPSTRRSSLVDQVPLVKKIRKRLYSKRMWSIDLGQADVRQHLFGGGGGGGDGSASGAGDQSPSLAVATSYQQQVPSSHSVASGGGGVLTSAAETTTGFARGPPTQLPNELAPPSTSTELSKEDAPFKLTSRIVSHRRHASIGGCSPIGRTQSSSLDSRDSFVMEMSTIRGSTPCLLDDHLQPPPPPSNAVAADAADSVATTTNSVCSAAARGRATRHEHVC